MAIQNKKEKKIVIRLCQEDYDKIKKIKTVETNFNLSLFVRGKILEKHSQVFPPIGTFRIG